MAHRVRSQGIVSELFGLLSHPTTSALIAFGLAIGVLSGARIDLPFAQFLVVFLLTSIVARSLYVRSLERKLLMLVGAIGLAVTTTGLVFDAQSVGHVTLRPQQVVEAYQRGEGGAVNYHLGGPLVFDVNAQDVGVTFKKNRSMISYQRFQRGEPLMVSAWRFKLLEAQESMQNPTVTFKFIDRETKVVETQVLRVGESKQVGAKMTARLDRVSHNPKTEKHPAHLQALLTMQWRDQAGQPAEKVVYLQSNFPELDEKFGQSPYLTTIEGVTSTPTFKMEVRRYAPQQLIQLGAVALLIALMGLAFFELNDLRQDAHREIA